MPVRKLFAILAPTLLLVAVLPALPGLLGEPEPEGPSPSADSVSLTGFPGIRNDPRVQALLQAYGSLLDSVTFSDEDAVFHVGGRPIYFQDGRMLGADRMSDLERFESIFYRYPLDWPTEVPPLKDEPTYCRDFLDFLFGQSETESRSQGRSVTFLDHRMFVNSLLVEPLQEVENELRSAALHDPAVARWKERLDITYSFIQRDIAGTETRSYHAYGLAVDLVPISYEGKHMYWRWSRVHDREGWSRIPLARRWTPPQAVVEAFERQGFVWGGKWSHFDNIHFEYRPEIILYNRMVDDTGP